VQTVTPEDLRLAEGGDSTPEGKEQAAYKNSPEGQEVAKLPSAAAAKVAKGREAVADILDGGNWTETPDGGATMAMPNGAVIKVGKDGSYSIVDNKGYSDTFAMYSARNCPWSRSW